MGANRCFYLSHTGAVVEGFTVTGGRAYYGGAVYFSHGGTIRNCVISNNVSTDSGGGAYCDYGGTLLNCLLTGNTTANCGGGVYFNRGGIAENCTLSRNRVSGTFPLYGGGGVYNYSGGIVRNSILWGNVSTNGADYFSYLGGPVSYSCAPGLTGTGSITNNPQFADGANGDFHLKSLYGRYVADGVWTNDDVQSPCIDAGDPASAWTNEPMPNGGRINMGAYGNTPQASKSAVLLAVRSSYGNAEPPVGTNRFVMGTNLTCQVTNSPVYRGVLATQYVCVGWTGTGSIGSSPGGGTNTGPFALTNDSSVTWLWTTNYCFHTGVSGSGTVDMADGWVRAGSNLTITANAAENWHFTYWSGLPTGAPTNNAIVMFGMDKPYTNVVARFAWDIKNVTVTTPYGIPYPGTTNVVYGSSHTQTVAPTTNAVAPGKRAVLRGIDVQGHSFTQP